MEFISELEGDGASEGGVDKESDKQDSDNDGEESMGQIVPRKSGKRQKTDKDEAKNDTKEINLRQSKKQEKFPQISSKIEQD